MVVVPGSRSFSGAAAPIRRSLRRGCGLAAIFLTACGGGNTPAGPSDCEDQLKSLDLGVGTTVTLVKAFKSGDSLSLAGTGAVKATADVCLVKMIVGPGSPGPAGAPSTSAGIGIEVMLPPAPAGTSAIGRSVAAV